MIDLKDISRVYQMGSEKVYALNKACLHIDPGEFVSIIGPSGSGKSTLAEAISRKTNLPVVHLDQLHLEQDCRNRLAAPEQPHQERQECSGSSWHHGRDLRRGRHRC